MACDWPSGAPSAGFCGEDWSRSDPLDSAAGIARCVRVLRALGGRDQLGPSGSLRRDLPVRCGASWEAIVESRSGSGDMSGDRLGEMAEPVSVDLAFLSRSTDGAAFIRPSRVPGPLYDLLPAGAIDHGGSGAGAAAPVVAACDCADLHTPAVRARNLLR